MASENTVVAQGQYIQGCDQHVIGDKNAVHGFGGTCTGSFNCIKANRCIVYGDRNIIFGDDCVVHGNHNTIRGKRCIVYGRRNTIAGLDCLVDCLKNRILSKQTVVLDAGHGALLWDPDNWGLGLCV
jgi:hypothetical protein